MSIQKHHWCLHAKITPPEEAPVFCFNNYPLLLTAAQEGQGIALGWADRRADQGGQIDRSRAFSRPASPGLHCEIELSRDTSVEGCPSVADCGKLTLKPTPCPVSLNQYSRSLARPAFIIALIYLIFSTVSTVPESGFLSFLIEICR